MSGGYLKKGGLKQGEHQVVIFTFKGPITGANCQAWNEAIYFFKHDVFPDNAMGTTVDGKPTPKGATAFSSKKRLAVLGVTLTPRKKLDFRRTGPPKKAKKK